MEFTLPEDIDSELLRWDDDEEMKDTSNHDITNKGNSASSDKKQEEQILQESAAAASSLDPHPNNYFTGTIFADQSLSNLPLALTKSNVQTFLNANSLESTSGGDSIQKRVPQHVADRNNTVEPIFPPNYFLSGAIPWDPSQAVTNPHAKASKVHGTSTSSTAPRAKDLDNNKLDDKKPAAIFQPQQDEQWEAPQISHHINNIAVHHQQQANQNLINQNAQNLVAAAAAAHLIAPEQNSLQGSRQTVTDASTNTGSSSSSHPSSSRKNSASAHMAQASSNDNPTGSSRQGQHLNRNPNQRETPPPFYLFDAPCELRANFLQAHRQHAAAPTEFQDLNSFHYGKAVNGYHPQMNTHGNPIMPASLGAEVLPNGEHVSLIDGRRKHKSKTTERNEREQQRAQKITELIDKLRNTMEQGGWEVEMKSKYQVLSTSANYLKHLIMLTKEKERNLQRAKTELAVRNQKLEEDRVLQDGRSGSDSVTSSLTASSFSDSKDTSTNVGAASVRRDRYKRKITSQGTLEEHQESLRKCQKTAEKDDDDSNQDSNNSNGHLDSNSSGSGLGGKNISIGKMSSSLSDMTDSNRGSSDGQRGSSGSNQVKGGLELSLLTEKEKSDNSISSTAAVVSGVGNNDQDPRHTPIIYTKDRKRKHQEKTSIEDGFQLSYQEVFLASNVPQLIATPAGRIVACNDFFFRVTGLTAKDVKKITIFSMVEVGQLSKLFDLVADSLRKSNTSVVTESTEASSKSSSTISSKKDSSSSSKNDSGSEDKAANSQVHFETATLPCVPFPQELRTKNKNVGEKNNLFMNVTFMYDENPSKRCIHCALTDTAGTGGKIGTITPQLLSMLFPYGCVKAPPTKNIFHKK